MKAYDKLRGLLLVCQGASNMWERQKYLADFYETGQLAEVVGELTPAAPEPILPEPVCGCGKPAKYLVYDQKQPHCLDCMMDAIDCDAEVTVHKIC